MKIPLRSSLIDAYDPAMKITDPEQAHEYFEALVEWTMRTNPGLSREHAEEIERMLLGYWSQYFGEESCARVQELYGAVMPLGGQH